MELWGANHPIIMGLAPPQCHLSHHLVWYDVINDIVAVLITPQFRLSHHLVWYAHFIFYSVAI